VHEQGVAGRDQRGVGLGHRRSLDDRCELQERRTPRVRVRTSCGRLCDGSHA
jgi:hypothetical protein